MRTGRADQEATLAKTVDQIGGDLGCRCFLFAVTHKFEPDVETRSTHVADRQVAIADLTKPGGEMATNPERIFGQPLVVDRVKHGEARGSSDRVASEPVEIFRFRCEEVEH